MSYFFLILAFNIFWGSIHPAVANVDLHPLAPPDTGSPRSTLMYFVDQMDRTYRIQLEEGFMSADARESLHEAGRSLDLSKVAPADRQDVGFESALLLKEILDRMDIPAKRSIPDAAAMTARNLEEWTLPNTEITIARASQGPFEGEYLFNPATVARLREFYERIKVKPYKRGASVGIYEDYIYSPGPMVSNRLINSLPGWAHRGFLEQAVWQWVSALLLLIAGTWVVVIAFGWSRSERPELSRDGAVIDPRNFLTPLVLLVVAWTLRFLIDEQINFTGTALDVFNKGMRVLLFLGSCWFILIAGYGMTSLIVSSPRLRPRNIDPNLTRLMGKVITWVFLLVLLWNVSAYIGISFTAVFASAGIAGIAFALAARESLANFFGGISILMDSPFKTGDYILLESGERGVVVNVGMRSTRILTRDDILIAIPNSIITSTKIINESAPQPRFRVRIKIGVSYDSGIDLVEKTLLAIAQSNPLVSSTPDPRVRFRSFGDSALDYELLCWAHRPQDKGRLIHELNREIYATFKQEGIEIPFPQRDVHLIGEPE
jgi:MscS family membrane protein